MLILPLPRGAGFDAPVYPGDVLTTDMWQDRNVISFRCHVNGNEPVVLEQRKVHAGGLDGRARWGLDGQGGCPVSVAKA